MCVETGWIDRANLLARWLRHPLRMEVGRARLHIVEGDHAAGEVAPADIVAACDDGLAAAEALQHRVTQWGEGLTLVATGVACAPSHSMGVDAHLVALTAHSRVPPG